MATDAEATDAGSHEGAGDEAQAQDDALQAAEPDGDEDAPFFVEVWNDYDPSMRFVAIFPVGEKEGARESAVGYYIIEPGKHTGLHSDNVEEIAFVAEGEGEAFMMGGTKRLEPGKFVVFTPGIDHDIYAQGNVALRLLSFFPTTEIESTFQQVVYPMGGNVVSSKPPANQAPVVTELDPNNLPENFPFTLEELGMAAGPEEPRELTRTERLLGMTEPGKRPEKMDIRVIDPKNPDVNLAEAMNEPEGEGESSGEASTGDEPSGS